MSQKEEFLNFLESVKPEKDFDLSDCPKPPNYQEKSYWAALPDQDGSHNLSPDIKPSMESKSLMFFISIQQDFF